MINQICEKYKKNGEKCKYKAKYIINNKYLCGIHKNKIYEVETQTKIFPNEIFIRIINMLDEKDIETLYKITFFKDIINKEKNLNYIKNNLYIITILNINKNELNDEYHFFNTYYDSKYFMKKQIIKNIYDSIIKNKLSLTNKNEILNLLEKNINNKYSFIKDIFDEEFRDLLEKIYIKFTYNREFFVFNEYNKIDYKNKKNFINFFFLYNENSVYGVNAQKTKKDIKFFTTEFKFCLVYHEYFILNTFFKEYKDCNDYIVNKKANYKNILDNEEKYSVVRITYLNNKLLFNTVCSDNDNRIKFACGVKFCLNKVYNNIQ